MTPGHPPRSSGTSGRQPADDLDEAGLVRVSDLLRRPVVDSEGTVAGRLADITISHGAAQPRVARVLVRGRHGLRAVGPGLADLGGLLDDTVLHLGCSVAELERMGEPELDAGELRLGADVVDAQIVDLRGHHLVRVGDVLLAAADADADADADDVVVVGVEVDVGAVLRRLGMHRIARRVTSKVVPWADLHLLSTRGHQVQLESRSAHLDERSPEDLAHLLARLSVGHAADILEQSPGRAAAAVAASHDTVGARLLASLPEPTAVELLEAMPPTRAQQLRSALSSLRVPTRRLRRTHGWRRHPPPSDQAAGDRT